MEIELNSLNNESDRTAEEDLYFTTMKLLEALGRIQQHRQSSSSSSSELFGLPKGSEDEEGNEDTLQIMCVIDEVFGKEEETASDDQNVVYQNENIAPRIRSALLIERLLISFCFLSCRSHPPLVPHRASCRIVLQDLDAALRDVKLAISLDPKNALARKCRYKVYRNMANEADEDDESETDELDLNGASSDDERGHRPSMKRLLMKGAFEALAGAYFFLSHGVC
jgi:hypothetical protein